MLKSLEIRGFYFFEFMEIARKARIEARFRLL